MHPGGPAGAGDPASSRRPSARPTRTVAAWPEPERHHEGQRGELQRDGMRSDRRRADPAHEIGGEREHAHFQRHGRADRPAEPDHRQSSARRSNRHQLPNRWKRRNWRSAETTAMSAPQMISQVSVLPMPPPTSPSAGSPKWPKISDQLSSALRRDSADAQPQHDARPLERGDEVAQQLEQQPGRRAPHVGAQERLALAGELRRLAERAHQVADVPQQQPVRRHARRQAATGRRGRSGGRRAPH